MVIWASVFNFVFDIADAFVSLVLTILVCLIINLKSPKARIMLVIKNGKMLEKALKGERLNMDDLIYHVIARTKDILHARGRLCRFRT